MNEVFERLSDVFEELRSDAGEREYSIQTEEAKKADKELKKENREYEKFLSDLSTEQRNFLENYMDTDYCFTVQVGNKSLINRHKFEEFLNQTASL